MGTIRGINGSTGWTTTGISSYSGELEANGTAQYLHPDFVGITTEKQNGGFTYCRQS